MTDQRQDTAEPLDCRSEEGITVGLIDALISIVRILSKRDLGNSQHVKEALKDFLMDADMGLIMASAEAAFDRSVVDATGLHSGLQQDIVAVIRDWPKLEEFMRTGDIDGHPQQFVSELVIACMSRLEGWL